MVRSTWEKGQIGKKGSGIFWACFSAIFAKGNMDSVQYSWVHRLLEVEETSKVLSQDKGSLFSIFMRPSTSLCFRDGNLSLQPAAGIITEQFQ